MKHQTTSRYLRKTCVRRARRLRNKICVCAVKFVDAFLAFSQQLGPSRKHIQRYYQTLLFALLNNIYTRRFLWKLYYVWEYTFPKKSKLSTGLCFNLSILNIAFDWLFLLNLCYSTSAKENSHSEENCEENHEHDNTNDQQCRIRLKCTLSRLSYLMITLSPGWPQWAPPSPPAPPPPWWPWWWPPPPWPRARPPPPGPPPHMSTGLSQTAGPPAPPGNTRDSEIM